jgi:dihydrolipoamide dehydrogenase
MHVTLIGTGNMARGIGSRVLAGGHHRLTGAYALGPEAGEWLQQATLAIRARVSLDVLRDTIQPFPTFSEIYLAALKTLHEGSRRQASRSGPARRKELAR